MAASHPEGGGWDFTDEGAQHPNRNAQFEYINTRVTKETRAGQPVISVDTKVEHRLFSFISSNWRGEPPADSATVVNLISKTTTTTGLKVSCRLDRRRYPIGRKISDKEWATINLLRDDFHGDWNYTMRPHRQG